ncbi:hypothetical protein M1446_00605 [Candidatus Dependentiae bacterium]|nr:hypothetical protein [Candidatus Dependentiae bacterium]
MQEFPAETLCNIVEYLFGGLIDTSKTVQQNIRLLFKRRAELASLSPYFKNLIMETCKPEVLKAIGQELSKLLSSPNKAEYFFNQIAFRESILKDFSQNQDVLKALTYVKAENGYTLLHFFNNDLGFEALKKLVDAGADVNAKNEDGKTPLDNVLGSKYLEIKQYLINHGAKSGKDLP